MIINRSSSIDILAAIDDHEAATPELITNELGLNPSYIRSQLRELDDEGYVDRPSRGLYTLTRKGERAVEMDDLVSD